MPTVDTVPYLGQMTTASDHMAGQVPAWTISDRLRKAREHTGLSQAELADAIGISRNSVSNYESGSTAPRMIVLNAWALHTGVPRIWLEKGEAPASDVSPGGGGVRHQGLEPRTRCLGASSPVDSRHFRVTTTNRWIVVDEEAA